MTENRHTVSTDALATLGTIIDESCGRDAIHLAVEPTVAGEMLRPGEHIRIENGLAVGGGDTFGIVDPFLKAMVMPGQRFWFVVYPRQITSLRHVWEHPKFGDAPPARQPTREEQEIADRTFMKVLKPQSIEWVREFCRANSGAPSFETLMRKIEQEDFGEEWLHIGGEDASGEIPDEFWDHVENIVGRKLGEDERPQYFSCAC